MRTNPHRGRSLLAVLALCGPLSCSNPTQPGDEHGLSGFDYTSLPSQVAALHLGTGRIEAADLHGSNLVIANYNALTLIDVSEPTNPQIVEQLQLSRYVMGLAVLRDNVLVVGVDGVHSLDLKTLTGPAEPALTFEAGEQPTLLRYLDRCFLGTSLGSQHSLYILDVEDPSKPLIQSKVTVGARITDIAQEQNLVLVGTESGAIFLDVSNVDQIRILATIGKGKYVALANGFAYVNGSYGSSGVTALDVHDPTRPIEIGSALAPAGQGRMVIEGSRLFVDVRGHVEVIDVVDRRHLQPQGSIQTQGRYGAFFRDGHIWGVGDELTVHRIGNTMIVPPIGESGILSWSRVQLDAGRLYARGAKGFFALSVDDTGISAEPTYLPGSYQGWRVVDGDRLFVYDATLVVGIYSLVRGSLLASVDLTDLAVRSDDRIAAAHARDHHLYLVVTDRHSTRYEVFVIDVGQVGSAQVVGRLLREGDPHAYFRRSELLEDQRLVVTANGFRTGLEGVVDVIDLSRPYQPSFESRTPIPSPGGAVAFHRGFMYVDTYDGLVVLDSSDPTQPRQVALFGERPHQYQDMVVKKGFLYGQMRERMDILDVANPRRPRLIATRGHLSTNFAEQLLAGDNVLYAVMNYGIQVLPLHVPGY